jgi:lipopolysaccharide transport system permease protein
VSVTERTSEPPRLHVRQRARELYAAREILWNLVRKELKVKYTASVLGAVWSLLNPVVFLAVFSFVTKVLPGGITDYPAFLLAGLLAWNLFSVSLSNGAQSVIANANLVKKVYFPREILPLSIVLSNLVNFLLSLLVFLPLAVLLGARFSAWTLALPAVIAVQLCLVTGLALLVAALNVFYRDTEVVLDVGLTAGFFLTPIFYELELLPNQFLGVDVWRFVYTLNPMATLITDYRYILLYQYPVIRHTLVPAVLGLIVLGAGWYLFRRASPAFSEEV